MMENGDLSQMAVAARVFAAIGRPAADPALPVLTRAAVSVPAQVSDSLFESLLALDPASKIAQEELQILATAKEAGARDRLYAHGLLLKAGHDVPTHLKMLRDALKDAEAETRSIASRLILENSDNHAARKEAAEEGIRLVENDDQNPAYGAAYGLRRLEPADRDMERTIL